MKRRFLSEQKLVVILFVMVFIIFSLAQEDTKKIEKMYQLPNTSEAALELKKNAETIQISEKNEIIPAVNLR